MSEIRPTPPLPASLAVLAVLCSVGSNTPTVEGTDEDGVSSDVVEEPRTLDARRLRATFLDLLGRPPLSAEREEWSGRNTAELLDRFLGSEPFWRNWLEEELYYFLLIDNLRPPLERVESITEDLVSQRLDVRAALHRIAISPSFDRRNPGPDTFVTVVMEQLLGTTVQKQPRELEVGKRIYDGGQGRFLGRTGSSQADVVRIAIEDRRALRHFLTRQHQRLLRREPGTRELSGWSRGLEDGHGYPEILREWFLSEAYDARLETFEALSNRTFVNALFVDLLDRLPERDEARRMRNALDGLADAGPLRSVLARLVLDSGAASVPSREEIADPTEWVRGLFERLLGRSATADELFAFVSAYHDSACRPEMVLYAIVSHPEYSKW